VPLFGKSQGIEVFCIAQGNDSALERLDLSIPGRNPAAVRPLKKSVIFYYKLRVPQVVTQVGQILQTDPTDGFSLTRFTCSLSLFSLFHMLLEKTVG
jgi:hypothetical protein